MANVTFSSPMLARDVTVYAIAGDRGTILAVAKAHKIPIPFNCQDGECGSCLIEVTHLDPLSKHCIALTEKEKGMLRQLGKITKDEIHAAEVNDLPPRYRLACQCFVRHEDILVKFGGDGAEQPQQPHITHAAKRFAGGIEFKSVEELLSYALRMKEETLANYIKLAAMMDELKFTDIARLFRQLAASTQERLTDLQNRANGVKPVAELPAGYAWPDTAIPDRTSKFAGDPALWKVGALNAAQLGEKRGYEFYVAAAARTKVREVEWLAKELAEHKFQHMKVLDARVVHEQWEDRNEKAN